MCVRLVYSFAWRSFGRRFGQLFGRETESIINWFLQDQCVYQFIWIPSRTLRQVNATIFMFYWKNVDCDFVFRLKIICRLVPTHSCKILFRWTFRNMSFRSCFFHFSVDACASNGRLLVKAGARYARKNLFYLKFSFHPFFSRRRDQLEVCLQGMNEKWDPIGLRKTLIGLGVDPNLKLKISSTGTVFIRLNCLEDKMLLLRRLRKKMNFFWNWQIIVEFATIFCCVKKVRLLNIHFYFSRRSWSWPLRKD